MIARGGCTLPGNSQGNSIGISVPRLLWVHCESVSTQRDAVSETDCINLFNTAYKEMVQYGH